MRTKARVSKSQSFWYDMSLKRGRATMEEEGTVVRTYQVPGISCDHCRRAIETALAPIDGVQLVTVDIDRKTVRVEGDTRDDAVRAAITTAGYEAEDTLDD